MIALIDYGAGNTASVSNILNELNIDFVLTGDKEIIHNASKIILPGVGEASSAMERLGELGLIETLKNLSQPFLGICLGMQLMCRHSEEADTLCLGIFDTEVRLFPPVDKIPHMGWNNFISVWGDIFKGVSRKDDLYYVHSYYAGISSSTTAICDYILPFSAAMKKDNFHAVQFHPEKSAHVGETILKNFLEL